jgi:hypothetical protein
MNSYLKSKRSDVCEHVLIYRIVLNWNMATGRSFIAIQRAACANTHPEVEWWYGSTTSSYNLSSEFTEDMNIYIYIYIYIYICVCVCVCMSED